MLLAYAGQHLFFASPGARLRQGALLQAVLALAKKGVGFRIEGFRGEGLQLRVLGQSLGCGLIQDCKSAAGASEFGTTLRELYIQVVCHVGDH